MAYLNRPGMVGAWTDTNIYTDGVSQQANTCGGDCVSPDHSLWFQINLPGISLRLQPNQYTVVPGSTFTISGSLTTRDIGTFTYAVENLFGLSATSPHLAPVGGTVISSLANVKKTDIVYDLGCGDGRIVSATYNT